MENIKYNGALFELRVDGDKEMIDAHYSQTTLAKKIKLQAAIEKKKYTLEQENDKEYRSWLETDKIGREAVRKEEDSRIKKEMGKKLMKRTMLWITSIC